MHKEVLRGPLQRGSQVVAGFRPEHVDLVAPAPETVPVKASVRRVVAHHRDPRALNEGTIVELEGTHRSSFRDNVVVEDIVRIEPGLPALPPHDTSRDLPRHSYISVGAAEVGERVHRLNWAVGLREWDQHQCGRAPRRVVVGEAGLQAYLEKLGKRGIEYR